MRKEYVKQHVVPQSYLRRFAKKNTHNKGYHIGVRINTKNGVSMFSKAVDDVAYVENYYDVPNREDPKYWEHYFSKFIEPLYGTPLENIIAKITLSNSGKNVLDIDDKIVLSKIICFQYQRIPAYLDHHLENGVKFSKQIREAFLQTYKDYLSVTQIDRITHMQIDDVIMKDFAFEALTDSAKIEKYVDIMIHRIWTVNYNNTELPFFTSDNPVLMYNFRSRSMGYSDNGIARQDTIIYFPVSSKIMIQIFPITLFEEIGQSLDGSRIIIHDSDLKFVMSANLLQIEHASKESYMRPEVINFLKDHYISR